MTLATSTHHSAGARLLAMVGVVLLWGCSISPVAVQPTGPAGPSSTPAGAAPTVSAPPAPPTPDATRMPIATPAPSFDATTWRRMDHATDQVPRAAGVASTDHGWVAVGSASDGGDTSEVPAAWTSPDGVTWTRASSVPLPHSATEGAMVAVTSGPQGLIAIGDTGRDTGTWTVQGAVWQSTDGDTWALVGSGSQFVLGQCLGGCPLASVAAGRAGIVVAGRRWLSESESEDRLWVSTDGNNWDVVQLPAPAGSPDARIQVALVTATADGFIATGTVNGRRAVVWASDEGRTWSRPVNLPDGRAARPLDAATGSRTTVIVGWRCEEDDACVGLAWSRAGDGTWTSEQLRDFIPLGEQGVIAPSGSAFVILGRADRQPTAWTSEDGVAWNGHALPDDGAAPDLGTQLMDIAGAPGSVLAVGWYDDDAQQEHDAVWISP